VKRGHKVLLWGGALLLPGLLLIPLVAAGTWLHMFLTLAAARREGVYSTPEEAMLARIERGWIDVERVDLEHAGPNDPDGSQPHVWFVVARVWADRRADGKPVGSGRNDLAGSFFLLLRDKTSGKGFPYVSSYLVQL
jgi:hypothetical protein